MEEKENMYEERKLSESSICCNKMSDNSDSFNLLWFLHFLLILFHPLPLLLSFIFSEEKNFLTLSSIDLYTFFSPSFTLSLLFLLNPSPNCYLCTFFFFFFFSCLQTNVRTVSIQKINN